MGLEDLLGAALELPVEARARLVHEIQLSIVEDAHAGGSVTPSHGEDADCDPELTAELRRRLDTLQRGEAQTLSRAEMKLQLARRRASRPTR